jgi:uncharacterized protein (TIGR03437 family)
MWSSLTSRINRQAVRSGLRIVFFLLAPALLACGAPMLRVNTDNLHPVWVQQGTNGPANVFFELYNIGDGKLNPQVKGSHSWLAPALGAARPCTFNPGQTCIPVKVLLGASALAAGVYKGVITVSDASGAFDAPQNVEVTVYVNTNVPDRLDLYAPPDAGASDSASFATAAGPPPSVKTTTATGGNWLAIASSGMGSFQFSFTHKVQAVVLSGMAAGDYNGAVALSNSSFAADNKPVSVAFHVTAQPIARPVALQLTLRGVQGGSAVRQSLPISNAGRGALNISGVTASDSGAAWLSAQPQQDGTIQVSADPGSLAPGFYAGALSIASNAANSPVTVSVQFEVQPVSAPLAGFGGVVDAASFAAPVAPGALASLFGSQLAGSTAQAQTIPLPASLANAGVFVNDAPAPLLYVSPGQINFQMPFDATPGVAAVRVDRQGQRGNTVTVQVAPRAAGIFTFPGTIYAVAQNASRGNGFALPDIPAFAGLPKAPAHPGDYIVLYGSGLGPTNPAVATGAAAGSGPLPTLTETPRVYFGVAFLGPSIPVAYAGFAPGFVGLYQVNLQIPPGLPAVPGSPTALTLGWSDGSASNAVAIEVEP